MRQIAIALMVLALLAGTASAQPPQGTNCDPQTPHAATWDGSKVAQPPQGAAEGDSCDGPTVWVAVGTGLLGLAVLAGIAIVASRRQ